MNIRKDKKGKEQKNKGQTKNADQKDKATEQLKTVIKHTDMIEKKWNEEIPW